MTNVISEKDVDEVLQISNVFTNVSKGQVAPTNDLLKAFSTTSIPTIVSEILLKGDLQVGEKERASQLDNLWKEVAVLVAEKCVDKERKRPFSLSMIEKAMGEVHFNVRADKPAKSQVSNTVSSRCMAEHPLSAVLHHLAFTGFLPIFSLSYIPFSPTISPRFQALECIKLLEQSSTLSIQRARMRVRITMPTKDGKRLKEKVVGMAEGVEEDEMGGEEWEAVSLGVYVTASVTGNWMRRVMQRNACDDLYPGRSNRMNLN